LRAAIAKEKKPLEKHDEKNPKKECAKNIERFYHSQSSTMVTFPSPGPSV
jgi:hypothetical protein